VGGEANTLISLTAFPRD